MKYYRNKIFNITGGNRGFTLIELLVGLVIGVVVMLGITTFSFQVMLANEETLRSVKLNQDLDSVMQVMVDEIRRAGYDSKAGELEELGIFGHPNENDIYINSPSSILFAYDRNGDGTLYPDPGVPLYSEEQFGYRLAGGAIEARLSCTASDCDTNRNAGIWEQMTDPDVITITSLSFDTEGSKCKVMGSYVGDYRVTVDDTPNNDTDDATGFPCMAIDDTNLQSYSLNNGVPPEYVESSFEALKIAPTDPKPSQTVEIRQVNVRLVGKVKRPAQFEDAASIKDVAVSIKIRNDRVCFHYAVGSTYPTDQPICLH